jgi:cbb3-type cytochrome oxidase maturation protein
MLALLFLWFFIKASRKGQFTDIYTPSVRILFDDEIKSTSSASKENENTINKIRIYDKRIIQLRQQDC